MDSHGQCYSSLFSLISGLDLLTGALVILVEIKTRGKWCTASTPVARGGGGWGGWAEPPPPQKKKHPLKEAFFLK